MWRRFCSLVYIHYKMMCVRIVGDFGAMYFNVIGLGVRSVVGDEECWYGFVNSFDVTGINKMVEMCKY